VYLVLPDYYRWLYFFTPLAMIFFTAGSIGYQCYRKYRLKFEAWGGSYPWIFWALGVLTLVYGRLPAPTNLLYYSFLLITACMIPVLFAASRHSPGDRLVGELSYPFYLIHFPVLELMVPLAHYVPLHRLLFIPVCILMTLGLSYLYYQYIEVHTEAFREGLYQKRKSAAALSN
jgi:peptidoglycan/LPS O-acetylase OafA/YrhL